MPASSPARFRRVQAALRGRRRVVSVGGARGALRERGVRRAAGTMLTWRLALQTVERGEEHKERAQERESKP